MRTRVKFCGCTSARDAERAVACGADAVGVIFAPSPRRVSFDDVREIARAVPPFVALVGVFVDPTADDVARAHDAGVVPQFSGHEDATFCEAPGHAYIKVAHVAADGSREAPPADWDALMRTYPSALWQLDTAVDGKAGGTGRTFDWAIAGRLARRRPIVVSGGLTPDNVAACIRTVRPFGVDVRSGIESDGVKDDNKMRAFVRAVKEADEQT